MQLLDKKKLNSEYLETVQFNYKCHEIHWDKLLNVVGINRQPEFSQKNNSHIILKLKNKDKKINQGRTQEGKKINSPDP